MTKYSIVRSGSEYVVQAGKTSVLRVSSRRRAAKLVTDAAVLMRQERETSVEGVSSTEREAPEVP